MGDLITCAECGKIPEWMHQRGGRWLCDECDPEDISLDRWVDD